jgi:hypothetical protein
MTGLVIRLMCFFCSLSEKIINNKFIDSMLDQLFIKCVWSPLVIVSISHGDWEDNSSLDGGGYLGIEIAGTEGKDRKGDSKGGGV